MQNEDAAEVALILSEGDNPDSKTENGHSVLHIAIDKLLQYDTERTIAFENCVKTSDDKKLNHYLENRLFWTKKVYEDQLKKAKTTQSLSSATHNLSYVDKLLAKYLMYADLNKIYKDNPEAIEMTMIEKYNHPATNRSEKKEMRMLASLSGSCSDFTKVRHNYAKVYYIVKWLVWAGASFEIEDPDGTLPVEKLKNNGFTDLATSLEKSKSKSTPEKLTNNLEHLGKMPEIIKNHKLNLKNRLLLR